MTDRVKDMFARLEEAQALMGEDYDHLIEAIVALASTGGMTILPRDDKLIFKPVILLPKKMYERAIELYGRETRHDESTGTDLGFPEKGLV